MSDAIERILEQVAAGETNLPDAARRLHELAEQPLGFATLDHHRHRRCGVPEVVYAQGKTPEQVVHIAKALVERSGHALVTRAREEHFQAIAAAFDRVEAADRRHTLLVGEVEPPRGRAIPVITAGTSDEPVAEEAEMTCRALSQQCVRINDVGVAGIARLVRRIEQISGDAGVIICIAGMEGALPSVVGGLVNVPVIAVPTSVGYGAAFGGMAALLGMLTSCAAGVSVVNIDNGFGAAYSATLIQRQCDATENRGGAGKEQSGDA